MQNEKVRINGVNFVKDAKTISAIYGLRYTNADLKISLYVLIHIKNNILKMFHS